jgi:hypothetical protein
VAVAHGVGQDVRQHGRDQVVERGRALGQGQGEQLLSPRGGKRLPDRMCRQRIEVLGHAVNQRVRGAAERLHVRFGHRARIGSA